MNSTSWTIQMSGQERQSCPRLEGGKNEDASVELFPDRQIPAVGSCAISDVGPVLGGNFGQELEIQEAGLGAIGVGSIPLCVRASGPAPNVKLLGATLLVPTFASGFL
jgi:hypothetical protein